MRKTVFSTEAEIFNVPLPNHGGKYTPISHKSIVDEVKSKIKAAGMQISNSIYKSTQDGQIALGQHMLTSGNDPDIKMMFAWVNSYNKQRRFSCGVGAYVTVCLNGMLSADHGQYSRKHIGSADEEAMKTIEDQFEIADQVFAKMVAEKNMMLQKKLTENLTNEIIGKAFMDNILSPHHLSVVKSEIADPSYQYNGDVDSAWYLYNHMTHAIKDVSPAKYTEKHVEINKLIMSYLNSSAPVNTVAVPEYFEENVELAVQNQDETVQETVQNQVHNNVLEEVEEEKDFFDLL